MPLSAEDKKTYYGLVRAAASKAAHTLALTPGDVAALVDGLSDAALAKALVVAIRPFIAKAEPWVEMNEVFELTLDGDDPKNDPLKMFEGAESYVGQKVVGKQTKRFRLVEVPYQKRLAGVIRAIAQLGEIPSGQWLRPFSERFPHRLAGRCVGIADPSWVNAHRDLGFPYLGREIYGEPPRFGLEYRHTTLSGDWLWLVEVP